MFVGVVTIPTGTASANSTLYDGGDGSASNPYEIANWTHLNNTRQDLDANYTLVTDLNESTAGYDAVVNTTDGFEPIGDRTFSFTGTFSGSNHTISELTINRSTEDDVGLFGYVDGGTIENVSLENADVTGGANVGGLVGFNANEVTEGTVTNSSATGTVTGNASVGGLIGENLGAVIDSSTAGTVTGSEDVGGLVGYNTGQVAESSATGSVNGDSSVGGLVGYNFGGRVTNSSATGTINGSGVVGGLVGENHGTVTNSSATGSVTGNQGVGGLVGYNAGGRVTNSSATGSVNGSEDVGGLVGFNANDVTEGTVTNSSATGTINGSEDVGGLVGQNFGTVTESYATGSVNGTGNDVGGLIGYNVDTVTESYATGSVNGDDRVGGLVGNNTGPVTNSYATGYVNGNQDVGGLVGFDGGGTVTDAYWDLNTTGQETSAGNAVGLTTVEMTGSDALNNMTGFDPNVWQANPSTPLFLKYPTLQSNRQRPPPQQSVFAGGDGTEANPYRIATWTQLDDIRQDLDANYTLVTDLNESTTGYDAVVNTTDGFEPIGDFDPAFSGTFTGSNYTISGLTINRSTEDNVGLFGFVDGGAIENVGIENADITGGTFVGGLVGVNRGTVINSSAAGDVTGDDRVGGLVGVNRDTITESYATGSVTGTENIVGGLVGFNLVGTVTESFATGSVTGDDRVGGLVGRNFDTVTESYAAGSVTGNASVGGLVGVNSGRVAGSYAAGSVTGDDRVGGLVGRNFDTVTESYAAGSVTGNASVGGLVGDNEGTVTDAYWDRNTTGQETSAGSAVGLTTVEMTGLDGISNMDGFVFPDGDGPWHVTDSYPALAWQDTDPFYGVTIESTNTPVTEGETLAVTTTVTNWAGAGTQSITLTDTDFTNVEQDSAAVTLTSGNNTTVQLAWNTAAGDAKNGTVTVASENTIDTASVAIDAQPSSGGSGGSGSHRDPTVSVYSVAEPGDDTESEAVAKRKVVSMRNVGSGDVIPINLSATNDGTGNTTQGVPRNVLADGIDIRFKRGGDYNLVVSARDINVFDRAMDDPDAAATSDSLIDALDDDNRRFVGETNQQPVGFIEVEANFDSARNVQEATHKFRVRKSYLEATGASVDTVRLYRNGPDGWRSLPTRQTNEDETFYSFEADTPGFSVFIIGTNAPILESGTASLDSFNETTGAVAATVPVENLGSEPGVFKTTLTANGTVVATQEVTVGANETADVTVAVTLNTAGSVTLQLAGQSIGTVTRLSEEPLPPEDDNDSASGLGVSGIGFTLFVALGLLLSFIIWRRR